MKNSWQRANREDERKRRVTRVWRRVTRVWRRVTRVRNSGDENKEVGNEEGGWRPTSEAMNREKYGIGHYRSPFLRVVHRTKKEHKNEAKSIVRKWHTQINTEMSLKVIVFII